VEKRWRECGSRDGLFVKGVDGRPRLERFGVDVSEGAGQVEAVEVGRSGEGDVSLGTLPSSGEVRLLEGERSREQVRVSSVLRWDDGAGKQKSKTDLDDLQRLTLTLMDGDRPRHRQRQLSPLHDRVELPSPLGLLVNDVLLRLDDLGFGPIDKLDFDARRGRKAGDDALEAVVKTRSVLVGGVRYGGSLVLSGEKKVKWGNKKEKKVGKEKLEIGLGR
jgi:hypothetical protein